MKNKAVFKPYLQHQSLLLPPSLEELIPGDHLVRVVNYVIDQLDIDLLLNKYKGGGTSSFHPRMMLKVWVFGYIMKVHSCRKLAKALREHIPFMWLAGMQQPDFRTLNDFRTKRMKDVIGDVFKQVVLFCIEQNYIDLSVLFTDGTKYQANGNKHKAVWRKNSERYKENVLKKLDELLIQIDEENEDENKQLRGNDLLETGSHVIGSSQELKGKITELSKKINEEQLDKSKIKRLEKAARELSRASEKLEKYENQKEVLSGRNSYNKTDPDATMMRSKEDQLLPCYNVQNSCQNQIIVHYSVGQNANDATEFKQHFESIPEELRPAAILGDSVFGTEYNYQLLEKHQIENYLMFPSFHAQQKRNFTEQIFRRENFAYDVATDTYTCPNNQVLILERDEVITRNNVTTHEKIYRASGCHQCSFFEQCCKSEGNRTLKFRPQLETYKKQASINLNSDRGKLLRMMRGVEVETPFADIKFNQGHRRLVLRGLDKVKVEIALMNLAHNMKKINTFMKKTG